MYRRETPFAVNCGGLPVGGEYYIWLVVRQILAVPNSSIRPSSCLGPWHSSLSGEVVDWIVGRIVRVQVVRHIFVLVGRLDVVYKRVSIGVGQLCTRSVLAHNLLVMECVHGYFG